MQWIVKILAFIRKWFKKPELEANKSTNVQIKNTLMNHVRDKFNAPTEAFVPNNNRKHTPGRRFFYINGKKRIKSWQ